MRRGREAWRASLWIAALGLACVPARGGWDVEALLQRYPALRGIEGNRLEDTPPHFVPEPGGLALILCRWTQQEPIVVSLPENARPAEREQILRALAWWEDVVPELGFEIGSAASARIEILIREPAGRHSRGSGDTAADCAVTDDFDVAPDRARVTAQMSFASIHLRRRNIDALGRERLLTADEFTGTLAHELGHALGFAGHVAQGQSVMSVSPEVVRRAGGRINRGETFDDATLAALYSLPSGVVVGRMALPRGQQELLRRFTARSRAAGLSGPLVRVGDRDARLFWRDGRGSATALTVRGWSEGDRAPDALVFEPNAAARRLLAP